MNFYLSIKIKLLFFIYFLKDNIDNKENLNYAEKCDGCFDGIAICFCVNCEKIFCRMCEEQIHIVPSNRLHER